MITIDGNVTASLGQNECSGLEAAGKLSGENRGNAPKALRATAFLLGMAIMWVTFTNQQQRGEKPVSRATRRKTRTLWQAPKFINIYAPSRSTPEEPSILDETCDFGVLRRLVEKSGTSFGTTCKSRLPHPERIGQIDSMLHR